MADRVRLTVDGREVVVPAGCNLVEAIEAAGGRVPHLCWEPGLEADGACGLCAVGVDGRVVCACETGAAEGMVVDTADRDAEAARRRRLELIRADHADDCRLCAKDGRCELQEACRAAGVDTHVDERLAHRAGVDESHPLFRLDRGRCILCGKCVKVCRDLQGVGALEFVGEGFARHVAGRGGVELGASACESCGMCVDRCPTASLTPRDFRLPTGEVRTICAYCGVGCALYLGLRDGRPCSVRADRRGPANRGMLCVKGRFGLVDPVASTERLETPLVRDGGGLLRPSSWDAALDLVAGRLRDYVATGRFAMLSSAHATTEENYLAQKFARAVMRTNNVDHCIRLCDASTVAGLGAALGSGAMSCAIDDIDHAACLFVIGSNATESHPVIGTRLRRARAAGTPMIVADPRRTDLATRADIWLRLRPGSDLALLAGMARVILGEQLYDREFVAERTEGLADFALSLESFPPERIEALTGLGWPTIRRAARRLARADRAVFVWATGVTQHTHGSDNVRALANLALMTGNVGKRGAGLAPLRGQNNAQGACDAGALPGVLPGYRPVSDAEAREHAASVWGVTPPAEPGLALTELWEPMIAGELSALWIVGSNPLLSAPDGARVEQALRSLDLLVVQDLFPTETARLAHVVLPAAGFAEKSGTFTSTERRVQLVRKALEPVGQSRPDWEILCDVARRMNSGGFSFASPAEVMDEMARLAPQYGGISHARLDRLPDGLQWPCPAPDHPGTPRLHADGFGAPDGRAAFTPLSYRPPAEHVDESYPLVLTTGRVLPHFLTGTMTRKVPGLNEIRGEERVEIHPKDAARCGVGDGDVVRVTSRRGSLTARACVTDRSPKGAVFSTFHFAESPTNRLTSAALDPQSRIAELKFCAVRVEPADDTNGP